LTFDLDIGTQARFFCTSHLIAKCHHPMFNRSKVIMLTNKLTNEQTDAATTGQHTLIFHRRSPSPARLTQWDDSAFFRFYVLGDLDLCRLTLTFELGLDFCTVYLITKFDRLMFSRSEVIVRTHTLTNKQTPLKTSSSLRYATTVGNK